MSNTTNGNQSTTITTTFQVPTLIVYGTVAHITKGSGGSYGDECTSGKYTPPEDEIQPTEEIAND